MINLDFLLSHTAYSDKSIIFPSLAFTFTIFYALQIICFPFISMDDHHNKSNFIFNKVYTFTTKKLHI